MNKIIECVNVSKEFSKSKTQKVFAVQDENLIIEKGVSYGLVGESSSGKTTTANMIVKLLKPTFGKIFYKEKDLQSLSKTQEKEFRRNVQMIFQNPFESLNPKMKIKDILEEPLIIHRIGKTKKERTLIINEIRTLCGISTEMLERFPKELSGGQQQRVAICAALILKPELLIFDEAVASLDVLIQAQILSMLKKMQKTLNLTYFFISHNLNVISFIADRIGVMYLGSIVEEGFTEDIIKSPKHPYTKALFSDSYIGDDFFGGDACNGLGDAPNGLGDACNGLGEAPNGEKCSGDGFSLGGPLNKERIILKGDLPDPTNPPRGCPFSTRCPFCADICKEQKPQTAVFENNHSVKCFFAK